MRKNRLEFRFALFRFEAKITKSKQSEKFEAKKAFPAWVARPPPAPAPQRGRVQLSRNISLVYSI